MEISRDGQAQKKHGDYKSSKWSSRKERHDEIEITMCLWKFHNKQLVWVFGNRIQCDRNYLQVGFNVIKEHRRQQVNGSRTRMMSEDPKDEWEKAHGGIQYMMEGPGKCLYRSSLKMSWRFGLNIEVGVSPDGCNVIFMKLEWIKLFVLLLFEFGYFLGWL